MLKRFLGYDCFAFETPFDMARHSSIGCGGFADIVFYPKTVAEVTALLDKLRLDKIPYYVVGNMTNVLPPDERTEKAIICMRNLCSYTIADKAFVYAGASVKKVMQSAKLCGKSGMEFFHGIPCLMGGALYMNAGAGNCYVGEIVENVLVYRDGNTKIVPLSECEYSYKHSLFMGNEDVILGATLRLTNADEKTIADKEAYYAKRRSHLPKGRSMGCVFKNPKTHSAGELIEKSGLKGFRVGGAVVSKTHANFIINDGGAKTADVKALIAIIKNAVSAQYGVVLEEEIRYIEP